MSYCPGCNKSVDTVIKTKISKALAKGVAKGTSVVANAAMKFGDEVQYEDDKHKMLHHQAVHNLHVRNAQSNMASNAIDSMNNATLDLAFGDDKYVACTECHMEIVHHHCHSRPEYLVAQYDMGTAGSKKLLAFLTFATTCLILTSIIGLGSPLFIFISGAIAATVSYFFINYLPYKAKGILNLLSDNIVTTASLLFLGFMVYGTGILIMKSVISPGIVREILNYTWMATTMVAGLFILYTSNQDKFAEIKETWALQEQVNESDDHLDQDAA